MALVESLARRAKIADVRGRFRECVFNRLHWKFDTVHSGRLILKAHWFLMATIDSLSKTDVNKHEHYDFSAPH